MPGKHRASRAEQRARRKLGIPARDYTGRHRRDELLIATSVGAMVLLIWLTSAFVTVAPVDAVPVAQSSEVCQ